MSELNRQIEMGWNRGFIFGIWIGAGGMLIVGSLLKLLW